MSAVGSLCLPTMSASRRTAFIPTQSTTIPSWCGLWEQSKLLVIFMMLGTKL